MSFPQRLSGVVSKLVAALRRKNVVSPKKSVHAKDTTAARAKEILSAIRRGEYKFSALELSAILKENNWLGSRQSWFESLEIVGDQRVKFNLVVPSVGRVGLTLQVLDLWHDQRVSSLDFRVVQLDLNPGASGFFFRNVEKFFVLFASLILRWKGSWRYESMSFAFPVDDIIRLYVDLLPERSPLFGNISVIGARIDKGSIIFYTFRRQVLIDDRVSLSAALPGAGNVRPTAWNRLAVLVSWILLGAYAFVLVHVTLPVLDGAFRLMPQGSSELHVWFLKQTYNLLVILMSYFLLRITMLPLYLKWNKSREELTTLISLEARDHEYLRPLTELVRKMQKAGQHPEGTGASLTEQKVLTATILQMLDLMSSIREQSRQRLLGMTRMRRGWLLDLVVGYLFIFSLEWMYYNGHLTPLADSIQWVNRILAKWLLVE